MTFSLLCHFPTILSLSQTRDWKIKKIMFWIKTKLSKIIGTMVEEGEKLMAKIELFCGNSSSATLFWCV
jgi:hypothetical protein